MSKRIAILALGIWTGLAAAAHSQEAKDKPKAEASKKPSMILSEIESRPDFARLDSLSWNDKGYYEIEYRTTDKARVEINIDAATGIAVDQD